MVVLKQLWVDESSHRLIKRLAASEGVSMIVLVKRLLLNYVKDGDSV